MSRDPYDYGHPDYGKEEDMSGSIKLSEKHGVNPSIEQCFVCMKDVGVVLFGKVKGDQEAPRRVCFGPNSEPCDECKGYMKQGVILISVREPAERLHICTDCKHEWLSPVYKAEESSNISGIQSPNCPSCDSRNVAISPGEVEDPKNPYRTGGWCVVREDFIKRAFQPEELVNQVLGSRMAFVGDETWDAMGLPRGGSDKNCEHPWHENPELITPCPECGEGKDDGQ
jgi:hypothetical protein